MKIETEHDGLHWHATDSDTYDGLPDSKHRISGVGESEDEAVDDLLEKLEDVSIFPKAYPRPRFLWRCPICDDENEDEKYLEQSQCGCCSRMITLEH